MKEFKGTKGEWKYDEFTRAIGIVSRDNDQSYGMVCDEVARVEFIDGQTEKYNAKLIEAAPEMLDILIQSLPYLQECAKKDGHAFATFNLADKIIKKALGE